MAINFPDSPTIGDTFTDATSGITYTWDGTRWAGNVGVTPTSPTYVLTAGDTMTGALTVPDLTVSNDATVTGTLTNPAVPIAYGKVNFSGSAGSMSQNSSNISTTVGFSSNNFIINWATAQPDALYEVHVTINSDTAAWAYVQQAQKTTSAFQVRCLGGTSNAATPAGFWFTVYRVV